MPSLVSPAIDAGSFFRGPQPSIRVGASAALRPWLTADAAAVADAYSDPDIQRWHVRAAHSVDEARQWIVDWQGADESQLHWALVAASTGALLGRAALKGIDLRDGTAGLAYWMAPAARGRGLCTQAVIALCQWAFDAGFHRLEIEHSTANPASCRVAAKAGFREEGIRRGAALHADGWHDMHFHGLLADDAGH
jgi:RimJ/RimL family protein N-acetyltransferase